MSNPTEPAYTTATGPQPATDAGQSPKNNSTKKIVIGVIIAALALCCVCGTSAGLGTAAFYFLKKTPEVQSQLQSTPEVIEPTQAEEINATPVIVYSPTDTTLPKLPTDTVVAETPTNIQGLGVSRDAMIQFFNSGDAFNFGQPMEMQGVEVVQGEHKTLCIRSNCAAVTLLGPANNLLSISVVVPTNPQNLSQTATAITLLMDAVAQFAGNDSPIPMQIMGDLTKAQAAGNDFEKTIQGNGYSITEQYFGQTHNAGIAITRQK